MTAEASSPAVGRGGMLRWGGIFAGLITGMLILLSILRHYPPRSYGG
jgi:hypothetical protein